MSEKPVTIEYFVSNHRMDLIRSHRWEVDYQAGEVLSILREWGWNYRTESYTEDRHTFDFEVTDSGTVVHDGRPLDEYARSRVGILTDNRGMVDPTIERTERTTVESMEVVADA